MPAGKIHNLPHLGFGNLMTEDAHNGDTLFMHCQHDLERLRVIETEKALKDMHHEFHRRIIVVQQQHLI